MPLIRVNKLVRSCIVPITAKKLIKSNAISVNTPSRQFFSFPQWSKLLGVVPGPNTPKKDGITEQNDYEIVYNARNMILTLTLTNYTILTTAILGMGLYGISEFIYTLPDPENVNSFFKFHNTTEEIIGISGLGVLNGSMFYGISNFAIRIYYSEKNDEYVLVFQNFFMPWKTKTFKCKPGDVKLMGESVGSVVMGNHKLGNKRMYLFPYYFRYPYYYNNLVDFGK